MFPPNQNRFSSAPINFGTGSQTPQFPQRIGNPSGGEPLPVDLLLIENNRNLQLETQPSNIHLYNMAGGNVNINLMQPSTGWPQPQQQQNVNMVQPQRQQNHGNMIMPRPFTPYPRPSLSQQAFHGSTSSSLAPSSTNSSPCNCTSCNPRSRLENIEEPFGGSTTSYFQLQK